MVNTKPQNKQMRCRRRTYGPYGYAMKISPRYHKIYDVKSSTKIDGMGPFKEASSLLRQACNLHNSCRFTM